MRFEATAALGNQGIRHSSAQTQTSVSHQCLALTIGIASEHALGVLVSIQSDSRPVNVSVGPRAEQATVSSSTTEFPTCRRLGLGDVCTWLNTKLPKTEQSLRRSAVRRDGDARNTIRGDSTSKGSRSSKPCCHDLLRLPATSRDAFHRE